MWPENPSNALILRLHTCQSVERPLTTSIAPTQLGPKIVLIRPVLTVLFRLPKNAADRLIVITVSLFRVDRTKWCGRTGKSLQ